MRYKYGGTPQCKIKKWTEELETLRQIALETGLTEEIKWGVPQLYHSFFTIKTISNEIWKNRKNTQNIIMGLGLNDKYNK